MRVYGFAVITVLLVATTSIASPPPYSDADVLALEISDSLIAPAAMVSQISQDLAAIHAAYPGWVDGVDDIHARPAWIPGEIMVQMTTQGWTDYQNGVFTAFDNLNALYGPVTFQAVALPRTLLLMYDQLYNPDGLSSIYAQVAGIAFAQPNYIYGDGSDITSTQVGRYLFKRGWGDCPSGCYANHYWDFQVTNGTVTLLAEWGTPTLAGVGDTPRASAALLGNAPNPFDHATDIAYRVTTATPVQLRVYDVSGRLVKSLHEGIAPRGAYTVSWDGTDQAGHRAPSGVYFCSMVSNGVTQTSKMLLIR
jgi:hypothetical protein